MSTEKQPAFRNFSQSASAANRPRRREDRRRSNRSNSARARQATAYKMTACVRYWSAAAGLVDVMQMNCGAVGREGGLGCSRALRAYWVSEQFQLLPLVTSAPPAGVVGRGAS